MLLIDTDTQGNLSTSFLDDAGPVRGVEVLLHPGSDRNPLPLVRHTAFAHIDIIPSSPAVARFDESDKSQWEMAELHRCFVDPVQSLRAEHDYIVFDCPPRLSLVNVAALTASDAIIIPMETADWGARGIQQVTEAVKYVRRHHNPRLAFLGYLPSRHKQTRLYHKAYLANLRKHYGSLAFDTVVPDLAAFERAVTDRIPVTLHDPASRASAVARRLFDEVESRLEEQRGRRAPGRGSGIRETAAVGAAA